ncbi:16S rRNA (guanine(527)-N(7))-methyltransferase RsmG [Anaeromyxobacter paludicola]|uniref:Ribosomal RNA small subunit methyltransferase G n=1 Tax=Anaeromyxobacter paludicola TaxID=2918171 RepID=A0ABN6N905_9BACT|nr:16S rRNA (guanine(527)-N(7))-methyltransferase RsmG [Anaeromyxobacter paludicola]BDG09713.1 hypothetical protein AMPC_28260 [Anaeromyxobacter paludicola]
MDAVFEDALRRAIGGLRLPVGPEAVGRLTLFADRLLKWNRRVNLTAVTEPVELAEKHFADSLALLPHIGASRTILDIGSGAGLPGLALACVRPELQVTCCDSVGKKVAFVKAVAAELRLSVRGVAVRATGVPEADSLPRSDVVVSRAMADPDRWVPLGAKYLAECGRLYAMLGRGAEREALEAVGEQSGLELELLEQFALPISGAQRAIARWRPRGERRRAPRA